VEQLHLATLGTIAESELEDDDRRAAFWTVAEERLARHCACPPEKARIIAVLEAPRK
jgi:hypothetical protein